MAPFPFLLKAREAFDAALTSQEQRAQFVRPKEISAVLFVVGPDIIEKALAQLAGGLLTPVTFSYGWAAYGISAIIGASGDAKLMPAAPSGESIVINGSNGYVRQNSSWVISRLVRDYDSWIHPESEERVEQNRTAAHKFLQDQDRKAGKDPELTKKPPVAGLVLAVYEPSLDPTKIAGKPKKDMIYWSGVIVAVFQLGIAAIPCGVFGDWGIMLVTVAGIILAFSTGALPQWEKEKWPCRKDATKDVVLTRGNGSQHAIAIMGNGRGLDFEDLATADYNGEDAGNMFVRVALVVLAILWVVLLITAAGLESNSWFLLAVGGVGMLQNMVVSGYQRHPSAFGVHLKFVEAIGHPKVMESLYEAERRYPGLGASLVKTFFPGGIRPNEEAEWKSFADTKKQRKKDKTAAKEQAQQNGIEKVNVPSVK